jgi:hypothetical protein
MVVQAHAGTRRVYRMPEEELLEELVDGGARGFLASGAAGHGRGVSKVVVGCAQRDIAS